MKKRILSILLTLCMVLMLCPVAAFADDYYTITQNFKYGTRTYPGADPETSPYTFEIPAGGSFSLGTVEGCTPYEFVGWKETGSGTVYAPYANVEELSSDLTFDAVYQVQGSLAITVDGFMPGNTPNDCTLSFASTIPGVTFGEEDIRDILWYNRGGPMDSADVFEAGTNYKCTIFLNNNVLELAPTVTVNGNTPEYCSPVHYNGVLYALEIGCELGTPVEPTLAVTVDGFEGGKMPKDITYTFETTNLGVTFSEDDILDVKWDVFDFYAEFFDLWYDWQAFQTGDLYRCSIELDSKGLTEAPAVTVNGKTPESCEIGTSDGKAVLRITCELGTPPAPAFTISGADVVCAQQNYEFSVTAADGAEASYFLYRCGDYGADTAWSRVESGVWYGAVPASEYGGADSIELTVYGTAANGKPATATKTVQISQDHIYENGVCGCGAKQEYTITYDCGEDVEGSIAAGVKTHGEPFTLSSETFTREGYIQTGWRDMYGIYEYDLGGVYTWEVDMTFYPVWEKLITLTVPFTTTVALGDVGVPGETTFDLAIVGAGTDEENYADVTVSGSVITNGAGDYDGTLTFTGPERQLWYMLSEGAFVQQVNAGEENWTYDDTVYGLVMSQVAYSAQDALNYALFTVPTTVDSEGNYYIDWDSLDLEKDVLDEMTFINTYAAHAYELEHDATHHWDECACGDIQNKEAHKYGEWKITKEATETEEGKQEHTCTVCGYTETEAIAKLTGGETTEPTESNPNTGETTSPQTGDNSHMALWIALLFVGGAGVIGTTVYAKKKRAK